MKKLTVQKLFPFIIVALGALVTVAPLFGPGFIATDDGNWMIIRLSAFYQSFREGQFPVRFLGRLNYEYGYPVANFLYPGFMYAGSFIKAVTAISFVDTVKVLIGFSVVASSLLTYAWLRRFFRRLPALFGAIGFLTTPYLAFDIYRRGSVGELFSFPWVALALYAVEAGKKTLFAAAVALLIVSHNSIALMMILFIIAYLLVTKRGKKYAIPLGLGIGLSAFFWIPALHERKYVVFDRTQVSIPNTYFISPQSLWLIGFGGMLAVLATWGVRIKHRLKNFLVVVYAVALFLITPVSRPVWDMAAFSSLFQFPFRFLTIGLFVGAWFIALAMSELTQKRRWLAIVLLVVFLTQFILGRGLVVRQTHPEAYYTTNEATTTVQDEYLPLWVSVKPTQRITPRVEFHAGAGVIYPRTVTLQSVDVEVEAEDDSIIQINTMYYPGWGVTVDDTLALVDYHNPMGVMRVEVPRGKHRVVAVFRETVSRFLADLMSVSSLVLLCIYAVYLKRR